MTPLTSKSRPIAGYFMGLLSPLWLGLPPLSSAMIPGHSPPPLSGVNAPAQWMSLVFPKGPNSAPDSTIGAGVRGSCLADNTNGNNKEQLFPVILMPAFQKGSGTTRESKTTLASPSLFVYLPRRNSAARVELQINYSSRFGPLFYRGEMALPSQAEAIVEFRVPDDKPLKIAESEADRYHATFTLICGTQAKSAGDAKSAGWIQRVALPPAVQAQIDQAEGLPKAQLFAENRIWADALMTLAQSYDRYQSDWQELLVSGGFNRIAHVPLIMMSSTTVISQPNP